MREISWLVENRLASQEGLLHGVGKQASKQASKQVSKQASKQASK